MKTKTAAVFLLLTAVLPGGVVAVPAGRELTWKSTQGTVVFSGKVHADHGLKCNDCHKELFKRKHGTAQMTMKELNEGKYCGSCHNGVRSFATTSASNCKRCHSGK
jgi:c(7)-type cytochrome triheme protein